jgi:DNA-binding NtrC family response regulator
VRRRKTVTHEVPHILLTGDDIPFLLVMEKLLRLHGYVYDCAHSVQAAAAALEACLYDLLIADLDFPGKRDLELVPASQGDGCSTPVIVLTGTPSVSTAVRSLYLAETYSKSLREIIAILKKTKSTSASKDLAAVRTKLEALLKDVSRA